MAEHRLDPEIVHHHWDESLKPVLEVDDGDLVHFTLRMAGHQQVHRDVPFEWTVFDAATLYHLQGPIVVKDARPGDTLMVEVVDLTPGPWGWCGILPGLGLLPEYDDEAVLRFFDLTQGETTTFAPGIHIPIEPFLGVMATLPDDLSVASAFPPHRGGGNMDTRHLVRGTTVMLPVFRSGALFSCGDPHAAQGDGEVCVNALETDMTATLRFTVLRRTISTPRFVVPPAAAARRRGTKRPPDTTAPWASTPISWPGRGQRYAE